MSTDRVDQQAVPVLRYARYMGPDTEAIYGHVEFCGACRRKLGGAYGITCSHEEFPEDTLADCAEPNGFGRRLDRSATRTLLFFAFCPWCGVRFVDEWWKDRTVQNERPIDHYDHPGSHKGDVHEFVGAVEGHILASSDRSHVCWCQPEITPGLMGCTVRHTVLPPPVAVPWDGDDDDWAGRR